MYVIHTYRQLPSYMNPQYFVRYYTVVPGGPPLAYGGVGARDAIAAKKAELGRVTPNVLDLRIKNM